MKRTFLVSLCTSALCASAAVVASPLTAFADTQSVSMQQDAIVLRQDVVSKPYGFVSDNTTYMPIWYLMQALEKLNIKSTWSDHTWSLTTSSTPDYQDANVGSGTSSIYLNGKLVQKVDEIAEVDPASGSETTYMPAWYIMQVLHDLGIHSNWNGSIWQLYTGSTAPAMPQNITLNRPTAQAPARKASDTRQQIVDYAEKFIGTPYEMGGESASGFDCSGLVQTVYKHFNISLPRTAAEQAQVGQTVSKDNLQAGDLVFFNTDGQADSHVGIYVGNGQFISATSSKGVRITDLNDPYYWGPRYCGSTDPLA